MSAGMKRSRLTRMIGGCGAGARAVALALATLGLLAAAGWTGAQETQTLGDLETQAEASMRDAVYKELAKAQEMAEADQYAAAIAVLEKLRSDQELNSYELAQLWNLYAYIYYSQDNYPKAIEAYEKLLGQADIPEALRTTTVYTLAQLYFTTEKWQKAIDKLNQWIALGHQPTTQTYELLAQAYYQLSDFRRALDPAKKVIELTAKEGKPPTEQSYLLLRVLYYELKDFQQVAGVLSELIKRFPKKTYWMQLISIYGELDDRQKQLQALELAYLLDYLDSEVQLVTLASLMLQNDLPFEAGKVLEKGLADKIVAPTQQHWRLLAQAWTLAHENEKAIPALTRAAELSSDGELDLVLAQTYMNLERWDDAARTIRKALGKGGVGRTDQAQVMLGQVLFSAGDLAGARLAFEAAQADSRSRQLAAQWLNYIESEVERRSQLASALR